MNCICEQPTHTGVAFAAVGDVHGHHHRMVQLLRRWERKHQRSLSFVLQVGDFEPHRDLEDLSSMSAPSKYKALGDFADFFCGHSRFPWPVFFIGGNHEPYAFLDQYTAGHTLTHHCHYLGRIGEAAPENVGVLGLSGIYVESLFSLPRPPVASLPFRSNKDFIAFNEEDLERALESTPADVILLHDWPSGLLSEAELDAQVWRSNRMNADEIGNPYARMLLEMHEPSWAFCGHMHARYETSISWPSGATTQVVCLGHVRYGEEAIAVLEACPSHPSQIRPLW